MKQQYITIDLTKWTTQSLAAKRLKISRQCLNNWMVRKRIPTLYIRQLGITLVGNIKNANELSTGKNICQKKA